MLTNRQALEIAHSYGMTLRCDGGTIRTELAFARSNDGAHGKSAAFYFDCYMCETARVAVADARAAAAFEDAAY